MTEEQRRWLLLQLNNRNIGGYTGSGYNQTTTDWLARVQSNGGSVTDTEAAAVNDYTDSIDVNEFDLLTIHGLQNQIAALTPVITVSPTLMTNVNSTTFTAGIGFTGNASTMYINTNYNPSTQGVKYTLNNCSFGVYHNNLVQDGGAHGWYAGGAQTLLYLPPGLNLYVSMNDISATTSDKAITDGLLVNYRDSSTHITAVVNGSESTPVAQNSVVIPNENVRLLSGSGALFNASTISISFLGSGNIDQAAFYTATQTLATTLGFNV